MKLDIGPLLEGEITEADRVFRLAFGTRNRLPDPMKFDGDAARLRTRFFSKAVTAIAARFDGTLVGSVFGTHWGSFAWLGPLSVRPDLWNEGIAQQLLQSALPDLERGSRHLALYTVAESPKHLGLYRKFGFWPGLLTLVMEKEVSVQAKTANYVAFSTVGHPQRDLYLEQCRRVAAALYDGLDLSEEILSADDQRLGDVILLSAHGSPGAFAIVHLGAGTEAGSNGAYVKFAAVRPGRDAAERFGLLLEGCQRLAAERGMKRLVAGVNTARRGAYSAMLDFGFRAILQGVAMHRPDDPGYDRPDAYAIDDWR